MHRINIVLLVSLVICLTVALAMPPRPGLELPREDYEEMARLGINVFKDPIRDIGKKGIVNTPGDVVPLVTGTRKFPVVCIKYPDYANLYSTASFDSMLFSDIWPSGSAKKYYNEVSYGMFTLQGTVAGWYTSANNKAYYGYSNGFVRAALLAKEAATAADATIDYASYDNDGDGFVDCFTCVHSGYGYEETGDGADIWSHSWSFTSAGIDSYTTNDPDPINGGFIKINAYVMDPERSNYSNKGTMVCIGVFVHEWGHALGLPDLYDTDGSGRGLSYWCLMAAGSWGGDGSSTWYPAHLSPWAKMELGWLNPTAVRGRRFYSIPQIENNSKAYWLISRQRTFKEYFLIENRRKILFDTVLVGQGLLIYHIDDSVIASRRSANRVNAGGAGWKYGVALEQADGLDELYNNTGAADADDPWPGGLGRTLFDSTSTTPNSRTNYPSAATLVTSSFVKNIPASAQVVSCTLASGVVGAYSSSEDAGGYSWIDSDTTGGPVYNWIDISGSGTSLGTGDDARYWFTLPFNFNFYGTNYDTVWVCTNGWISFGINPQTNAWSNTTIPAASAPNRAVYVFWDDLNLIPSDNANIYYQTFGTAPNRYCVITWKDARIVGVPTGSLRPPNQVTFQVILYEGGRIVLQYKDCAVGDTVYNWGRSATIGIENAGGTVGRQYLFNGSPVGNLVASERAIRFSSKDVGVIAIENPVGTIDSSGPIIPRARVKNNGTASETFNVTFRILGTSYNQTRSKTLNAGVEDTVNFPSWTPTRGTYTTRCSTYLSGDAISANDTLSGSVTVRVKDVGVTGIELPVGIIDSSGPIIPRARVKNYGNTSETFNVTFKIDGIYTNTRSKTLGAGIEDTVNFSAWQPVSGTYTTRCSTYLLGDAVSSNDTLSSSVTVRVKDVGVIAIENPVGIIDSSGPIIPRARVKNNGTDNETFNITFRIGAGYTNTRSKTLGAGIEDTVNFASWQPVRGTYTTRCSTYLLGDAVSSNDTLSGSVTVRVKDVGVTGIELPVGIIDSSGPIIPRARVKNYGSTSETFNVTFKIDGIYTNTRSKTLGAGIEDTVNFSAWQPVRGTYTTRCSTYLLGDAVSSNDTLSGSVTVRVKDVGVIRIVQPTGTIESTATITPKAQVKNYGTNIAIFNVKFTIFGPNKTSYTDDTIVTINAGDSLEIEFNAWAVGIAGNYVTKCSTELILDMDNSNNKQEGSFTIIAVYPGWVRLIDILSPNNDSLKGVAIGGAMTNDGKYLYAFHGNKTKAFYRYTPGDPGNWNPLESIPFSIKQQTIPPTYNKKYPAAGASLAYAGDNENVYAIKGGGTRELWVYSISGDSWHHLNAGSETIPSCKGIKGGSALVFLNGKLYLLAGTVPKPESANFFRYTPGTPGKWEVLEKAPVVDTFNTKLPLPKKTWKNGSVLAELNGTIYALRGGAKYGYFYKYDTTTGHWTYLDTIPQCDTIPQASPPYWKVVKKLPKAGAAMVNNGDDKLYIIKGGGSTNLWTYTPTTASFATRAKDTIPMWANKKPDKGAALSYLNNRLYLLKGNKTRQFWMYTPGNSKFQISNPKPILNSNIQTPATHYSLLNSIIDISPNPFTKLATIRYAVPVSGEVSLKLFNATGRLIETLVVDEYQTAGSYSLIIDNYKLKIPRGIYFLKYETTTQSRELKFIVQ